MICKYLKYTLGDTAEYIQTCQLFIDKVKNVLGLFIYSIPKSKFLRPIQVHFCSIHAALKLEKRIQIDTIVCNLITASLAFLLIKRHQKLLSSETLPIVLL